MSTVNCPLDLKSCHLQCPSAHVLLIILNRPRFKNCMTREDQYEVERVFAWFDQCPEWHCAVFTGAGDYFSTGGDLNEWNSLAQGTSPALSFEMTPRRGAGGLVRRFGKKPVIAAVNGPALGGGFELILGADIVVASRSATFGLPETKLGLAAVTGSLPRLAKLIGRPRAMELALIGDSIPAERAYEWGLVNELVPADGGDNGDVGKVSQRADVVRATEYAKKIVRNSSDGVVLTRTAVLLGLEHGSSETAAWIARDMFDNTLVGTPNMQEGLSAFVERREPKWKSSL